jgi:uncharacterized protein (TIGR03086 family)
MDLLDLYARASDWSLRKVTGAATQLDVPTPCEEWTVRQLLNHMVETGRYFAGSARGDDVSRPGPVPPDLLGDDPTADLERVRSDTLSSYGEEGVLERTGPLLGIAFTEQLLHGWDLATATGQDTAMPEELAAAAYEMIHGRFTDDQRKGVFGPELPAAEDATAEERLLAYTGRDASRTG